jgi:hypothetical protein
MVLDCNDLPDPRADTFNIKLKDAEQSYRWIPVDPNDAKYLIGDCLPETYQDLRLYL